ncbi:MAG: hypothetical protein RMJ88_11455 [Thermogemmata sp.]|nr:hypothetical protein [Thermogemmata sp.]
MQKFTEQLNKPLQSTGTDGLKVALDLQWQLQQVCPEAFPVLAVHVEIVMGCPKEQTVAAAWLKHAMSDDIHPLLDPVLREVDVAVLLSGR